MQRTFEARIVGNFHPQNNGSCDIAETLILQRERNNRHDFNAVLITSSLTNEKIGHMRKD